MVLGFEGFIWFLAVPEDRHWILMIPPKFIWSAIKIDVLACLLFLSALMMVSLCSTSGGRYRR